MAGIDPAQIAQARAAGYSDTEIADHLASTRPAEFKAAREAGYSDTEILAHLAPAPAKPSGIVDAVRAGTAGLISGPAATLKQFAGVDTGGKEAAAKIAPENYQGASFVRDGAGAIPQMVAEGAPGLGVDILSAKLGSKVPGGARGKALGAGLGAAASYLTRTLGNKAEENAAYRANDPNAPIETQDKVRAVATAIPEAALNSLSLGVGGTAARAVGAKGAVQAVGNLAAKTAAEAGTEGAQDVIGQVGKGLGTDRGVNIDPAQTIDSVVAGGATRGTLATPRALADIGAARKYVDFGGKNEQATADVADMARQAADGKSIANTKNAFEALRTVDGRVKKDLVAGVKALNADLPPETADVVDRARKGQTLTDGDLETVEAQAPQIAQLARRAHIVARLKQEGDYGRGNFVGGVTNAATKRIYAFAKMPAVAISAGASAAGLAPHAASMFAYGPGTAATLGGAYAAMRGLDKLTGNRSPLNKFVKRFETGQTVVSPATTDEPIRPPTSSVPAIDARPKASPWGTTPEAEPEGASVQQMLRANAAVEEGFSKLGAQAQKQQTARTAEVEGLLRQFAAQQMAAKAAQAPKAPEPPVDPLPGAVKETRGLLAQKAADAANIAKWKAPYEQPAAPTPAPETPAVPTVDPQVLQAARFMMRNRAKEQKAEETATQKAERQQAADAIKAERAAAAEAKRVERENAKAEKNAAKEALAQAKAAMKALNATKTKPTAQAVEQPVASPPAPEPAKITKTKDGVIDTKQAAALKADDLDIPDFLRRASAQKAADPKKVEEPAGEIGDYVPLDKKQRWGEGLPDREWAKEEIRRMGNIDPDKEERYEDNIVFARVKRRKTVMDVLRDFEADDQEIGLDLIEELHHLRRGEGVDKAITSFASKMSPEAGAAIRKRLDRQWINAVWSK